jgi:hypothetical protein
VLAAGLALVASLCYGVSNFMGPVLSRDLPVYPVLIAGQVVAFCVSAIVVSVAGGPVPGARSCRRRSGRGRRERVGADRLLSSGGIGPLSIVTPIGSLGAVVPVVVGVSGGEPLGPVKLTGMVLALGASRSPPAVRVARMALRVMCARRRCGRCRRRSASACS